MTFRDFIDQSLADYEERIRYQATEVSTIEVRLRGARQFAQQLLGDPVAKGRPTPPPQGDPSTRRFGGPQ